MNGGKQYPWTDDEFIERAEPATLFYAGTYIRAADDPEQRRRDLAEIARTRREMDLA